ncbi:MAG: tRNA (uridine(54)-C5)-methyltransferase TrmA [Halioglobus sp.]
MPLSHVEPSRYESLLEEKCARVCALLAPFEAPSPSVFSSPTTGFRMRAEFRVWHDGDDLNYVMFRPEDRKTPVAINAFPIACPAIQNLMPTLQSRLQSNETLRSRLFQAEFLSTLSGETLVTLVYHRKLDDEWQAQALSLAESLGISIVGRSRKQKCVVGQDFVTETLLVNGAKFTYQQIEQSFTQPNATVNTHMIEWACAQSKAQRGDLLELYCGNGNFTLPLAQHYDTVIATELSKTSVRAANQNIADNGIANVHLIRLSAEEVSEAMRGDREFRRLKMLPKPLEEYTLNTIFVDPPRAGLDEATLSMVAQFDTILYISCNPDTLAENLSVLHHTHCIEAFALFDQFPYTHHMECGVRLERRTL